MYNVNLLEEAFSTRDEQSTVEGTSEDKIQQLVTSMKVKLKSNPRRVDTMRKRIRNLVSEKLRKLQEREHVSDTVTVSENDDESDAYSGLKRPKKLDNNRAAKTMETDNQIDRLSKARAKDDLISCMEMKIQLFGHSENEKLKLLNDKSVEDDGQSVMKKEFDSSVDLVFTPPKLCKVVHIDQGIISDIDVQISSGSQFVEL